MVGAGQNVGDGDITLDGEAFILEVLRFLQFFPGDEIPGAPPNFTRRVREVMHPTVMRQRRVPNLIE